MEAITDGIGYSLFGDPLSEKEDVEKTHHIVATNIEGNSIEERIDRAEVVLFLKEGKYAPLTDLKVIKHHWTKGDTLITKGISELVFVFKSLLRIELEVFPSFSEIQFLPYSIERTNLNCDPLISTHKEKQLIFECSTLLTHGRILYNLIAASLLPEPSFQEESMTLKRFFFPPPYPIDKKNIEDLIKAIYPLTWGEELDIYENLSPSEATHWVRKTVEAYIHKVKTQEKLLREATLEHETQTAKKLPQFFVETLKPGQKSWVILPQDFGQSALPLIGRDIHPLLKALEETKIQYVALKSLAKDQDSSAGQTSIDQGNIIKDFPRNAPIEAQLEYIHSILRFYQQRSLDFGFGVFDRIIQINTIETTLLDLLIQDHYQFTEKNAN